MRKAFKYLCHVNVEKLSKKQAQFIHPQMYSTHKWLFSNVMGTSATFHYYNTNYQREYHEIIW